MSYPNDAPAAAWYPDPQTSGQVRWWDGTNWTEHVSKPTAQHAVKTVAEQLAAEPAAETVAAEPVAETVETVAAVETLATVTYIGRHAAGPTPAPRALSTAPRIRPRERLAGEHVELRAEVRVEALSYA